MDYIWREKDSLNTRSATTHERKALGRGVSYERVEYNIGSFLGDEPDLNQSACHLCEICRTQRRVYTPFRRS